MMLQPGRVIRSIREQPVSMCLHRQYFILLAMKRTLCFYYFFKLCIQLSLLFSFMKSNDFKHSKLTTSESLDQSDMFSLCIKLNNRSLLNLKLACKCRWQHITPSSRCYTDTYIQVIYWHLNADAIYWHLYAGTILTPTHSSVHAVVKREHYKTGQNVNIFSIHQ